VLEAGVASIWKNEVLFSLRDVEKYEKGTHTITLNLDGWKRVQKSYWWINRAHRAAEGSFEVWVNGKVEYSGVFHSLVSSGMPGAGVFVYTPLFSGRKLSIQIHEMEPAEDPRNNPRLFDVFREAGVLVD